jgi:hypothetical protein
MAKSMSMPGYIKLLLLLGITDFVDFGHHSLF